MSEGNCRKILQIFLVLPPNVVPPHLSLPLLLSIVHVYTLSFTHLILKYFIKNFLEISIFFFQFLTLYLQNFSLNSNNCSMAIHYPLLGCPNIWFLKICVRKCFHIFVFLYGAFPKVMVFFSKKKRHVSDNYGAGKKFKIFQFFKQAIFKIGQFLKQSYF